MRTMVCFTKFVNVKIWTCSKLWVTFIFCKNECCFPYGRRRHTSVRAHKCFDDYYTTRLWTHCFKFFFTVLQGNKVNLWMWSSRIRYFNLWSFVTTSVSLTFRRISYMQPASHACDQILKKKIMVTPATIPW